MRSEKSGKPPKQPTAVVSSVYDRSFSLHHLPTPYRIVTPASFFTQQKKTKYPTMMKTIFALLALFSTVSAFVPSSSSSGK
jgi:hypothetical protein